MLRHRHPICESIRSAPTASRRRASVRRAVGCEVEALENRTLLAVTASLTAGNLTVTLSAANDTATLTGTSAAGSVIQVAGTGLVANSFIGVSAIQVLDGGSSAGQSVALTSSGANQINLTGGISIAGIETVTLSTSTTLGAASFAETGASSGVQVNTAGVTTNGTMSFADPVTLGADSALDTTGGGATPAGAALTLAAVSGASHSLNLTAGTGGGLTFNGAVSNVGGLTATAGAINVNGAITAASAGAVSLTATSGIFVSAGIATTNGNLTLSANEQATPTSGNFIGVNVSGAKVESTGTGVVNVSGRGGDDGSGSQIGVSVSGASATITSGGGNVTVTGQGGGSGTGGSNYGVFVETAISAGGGGTVTVMGTAGANDTGNSDIGVILTGLGATITSAGGNVSVTGQGGGTGSGSFNYGVAVGSGSIITAKGTGSVTVMGTGGTTSGGSDAGVVVAGVGNKATIASSGGNVSVTGQGGGSDASGTNVGVAVEGNAIITAGGTGNVTVSGAGGATSGSQNYGVWLVVSNAEITSAGGNVSVTGAGGGGDSSSLDVEIDGFTTLSSGGSGNLTINANSLNVNGLARIQGGATGNQIVTIVPRTTGTNVNLGGADAPGTLGLSNTELGRITAGTLRIGGIADAGGITVTAPISLSSLSTLSLLTGGGVVDANSMEPDITVTSLAIQSASGINLDTAVSNVAFANAAGFIFIRNTGALTVGSVDGLSSSSNAGTLTNLSASSPITFASNVTSAGALTAVATDDGPVHTDNITVDSGMSIDCTGGDVILEAGDDIDIDNGAAVSAITGNVDLRSGFGDTDGEGLITIDGKVSAAATVALNVNAPNASEPAGTDSVSEAATGSIVASGLQLLKFPSGPDQPFALDASTSNAVGTIAVTTNDDVRFRDSIGLRVGTVTSPDEGVTTFGMVTNGHDVALTAGGNVAVIAGIGAGAGAVTLNSSGTITGGIITADRVAAQAVTGIGSVSSPVRTQVGTVEATTGTGGIFISNGVTLPITLNVGGTLLGGVQVTGASGSIQLVNKGGINILTNGGTISGPGTIIVQATGPTSDVATGGQSSLTSIRDVGNGVMFLRAGRDILLGDTTGFGAVASNGSISLTAGGNIVVNANATATVLSGSGGLAATAGGDITLVNAPGNLAAAPVFATTGGDIDLDATGAFTADSTGADAVFSSGGNITVTAANMTLSKALDAGTGAVNLNTAAGGTAELTDVINASVVNVNGGGSLFVDGPTATINAPVNVNAGTLGGTGTITGAVAVLPSTTLTPGHGGPGILTTGTDMLSNGSTFSVQLSGPTPGNTAGNYGQLDVNENVNLNNATLAAALTFVPLSTQTFTLVQATGSVSGQFAQGSSVVLNGITYAIGYLPHSVVLIPGADVSVLVSGQGSVVEGSTVSYTYNVANAGAGVAQNVVLSAPLPAGAVFVSASFGGAFSALPASAYNPATGTVNLGTVPAGAGGTLTLMVTLPEENPGLTFSASVATTTLDTNLSNNNSSLTTQVTDAPLTAKGRNVSPSQGSKTFNNVTLATFTDANLLATAADFTATVNWGDGTVSTAQVVANSDGSFSVIASHSYGNAKLKSYALSIQIVDDGGSTATAASTARLNS